MNQEQLSKMVEKIVSEALQQNLDFISNGIAANVNWADGPEKASAQMAVNAVDVSMKLSVQMILTILYQTGVLEPPESISIHPKLTVIRGGADSEAPETPNEK